MALRTLVLLFIFAVTHLSARDLRVTIAFPKGEKIVVLREGKKADQFDARTLLLTFRPGQRALIELIREFRFPKDFEFPAVPGGNGKSNRSSRQRPREELFPPKSSGWAFEMVAKDGPRFFTLNVRAEHTLLDFVSATYGEAAVALGDKVVAYSTSTDFTLLATPGKSYKIPVRKGRKTIKVTITCDYVK